MAEKEATPRARKLWQAIPYGKKQRKSVRYFTAVRHTPEEHYESEQENCETRHQGRRQSGIAINEKPRSKWLTIRIQERNSISFLYIFCQLPNKNTPYYI